MIDFSPAPASLPANQRVYAIGDVHGCLDRLASIHEAVAEDLGTRPIQQPILVHLGDYIDRGPESAQVVEWLVAGAPVPGARVINLMGNHELMMLSAITSGRGQDADLWLSNGGSDSLYSWGVPRKTPQMDWASYIPVPHLLFLRDLATHFQAGQYYFVHAGIRPGLPLAQQTKQDMLWIREPFLSSTIDHGVVVVHGHTPRLEPLVRPNRIAIDTGAVLGGALTCLVLEKDQLGFMRA
ncbi:MAG: serine/threonine protein phosphatase [Acetobacteraceae bacterium]|nr:serine/threonine protein phosphatase [Acetobacteraceae bacterium]